MATTLARMRAVKPARAEVSRMRVIESARISNSFVRVTVASDESFDAGFDYLGFDQWVRLFLPSNSFDDLTLPDGPADGWYSRWLGMPTEVRPACRNYTLRSARRVGDSWLLEIDFVLHQSASGAVEGVAANWALHTRRGDEVGVLDQGILFQLADDFAPIVIVSDETGLPGVDGIARSLPSGTHATLVLEVPRDDDRRELPSHADLDIRWVTRAESESASGCGALQVFRSLALDPAAQVYTVGEASFVLDVRRHARAAGIPKSNIDFCAYWRADG